MEKHAAKVKLKNADNALPNRDAVRILMRAYCMQPELATFLYENQSRIKSEDMENALICTVNGDRDGLMGLVSGDAGNDDLCGGNSDSAR